MALKTPIVILTGYLGSGKTTLLRHLIDLADRRLAIVMNEFGALPIDAGVVAGKNIQIAALEGGCVCCSLLGDFEAAVAELIETVHPDEIILETTGLAEPEALIIDIAESCPTLLIDAVVAVVDADATARFPAIGRTGRMQIEAADLIVLNKIDLITEAQRTGVRDRLKGIHPTAPIIETVRGRVDPGLILGGPFRGDRLKRPRPAPPPQGHLHPMESFEVILGRPLDRRRFEAFVEQLPAAVYRAKGFVPLDEGAVLFNFVAGRAEMVASPEQRGPLGVVFIGEKVLDLAPRMKAALSACGIPD